MFRFTIIILAAIIAFYNCSTDSPNAPDMAGGSSDQGNALTGLVTDTSAYTGTDSAILVGLFTIDYVPLREKTGEYAETTYTSVGGSFKFDSLEAGYYNVFIKNLGSGNAVFISSIHVCPDSTTKLGTIRLDPTGSLAGTVYDSLTKSLIPDAFIYLNGSPFFALQQYPDTLFTINELPAGAYTIKAEFLEIAAGTTSTQITLSGPDVEILPGTQTQIDSIMISQ
jgi:hypothetical protein